MTRLLLFRFALVRLPCVLIAMLALALCGCGDDEGPTIVPDEFQVTIDQFGLSALPAIPYPANNQRNVERIALGHLLFFDPILGGESAPWVKEAAGVDPYRFRANDVACATCHFPSMGFADDRKLGAGVCGAQFDDMDLGPDRVVPGPSLVTRNPVGTVPRNSPAVLNTAFNGKGTITPRADSFQFMDGRVETGLDEQAFFPITSRDEMAGDAYGDVTAEAIQDSVVARLRGIPEYVELFIGAFPGEISQASDITLAHYGRAIGAYERELITPGSRYDRFVSGDRDIFDDEEKEGFRLFFAKGRCGACHGGPMLADFTFRVQGVGDDYEAGFEGKSGDGHDYGRYHADESEFADQRYAFRVTTVRNVDVTAPFFHSGSAATLREVLEFYNRGGRGPDDITDAELSAFGVTRDPDITPLGLSAAEMDAIEAFMLTTAAPVQMGPRGIDLVAPPERVPSGLVPAGVATPEGPGPFWPTIVPDEFQVTIDQFGLSALPAIPYPANNQRNVERIALGHLLFFDPILGGESAPWVKEAAGVDPYRFRANDVACATCHFPSMGFADDRKLGAGVCGAQMDDMHLGPDRVVPGPSLVTGNDVGTVPRNSPAVLNTAFNGKGTITPRADSFQFMDGRVDTGLDEQAFFPITSRDEMAGDAYGDVTAEAIQDSVVARLRGIPEYVELFIGAFPGEISQASDITLAHYGRAIGAYERELITPGSRYDRFVSGDRDIFDDEEKEGFRLFFAKGRCGACHGGPMLADFTFRVQGVGDDYEAGFEGKSGDGHDYGRYHADESEFADQRYAFRVTTVRNVDVTAPFFHSGSAATLREVLEFYNRGGRGPDDIPDAELSAFGVTRDPDITPLDLSAAEMDAIEAFMLTTAAPVQMGPPGIDLVAPPERVPSGLVPAGVATPEGPGPF